MCRNYGLSVLCFNQQCFMLSVIILLLLAEEMEKRNEVKKFNNLSYVYVYILMSRGGLM